MTVEIATEDHQVFQELVNSGRFHSVSEAIHASLQSLVAQQTPDEEWKRHLDEKIDAGLADIEAGRYRPASEFLVELKNRYGA